MGPSNRSGMILIKIPCSWRSATLQLIIRADGHPAARSARIAIFRDGSSSGGQVGEHRPQAGREGGVGAGYLVGHDAEGGGQGAAEFGFRELADQGAVERPGQVVGPSLPGSAGWVGVMSAPVRPASCGNRPTGRPGSRADGKFT